MFDELEVVDLGLVVVETKGCFTGVLDSPCAPEETQPD